MPPLHRAIAFEQMHQVAVLVAEELHFDMARAGDELLDEDIGAAEGRERFALGLLERRGEILSALTTRIPRPPPPLAAFRMTG